MSIAIPVAPRPSSNPSVRPLTLVLVSVLALLVQSGCAGTVPLPPKAVQMNELGAAALAAGDLATASSRLGVALEYSPRFTEAWVNLGLVELSRGNFDVAHGHFTRARDLNPDLPSPHHALGLLEDRRGRPREAEHHYVAALKVDPGFAPSRANFGRNLFARGAFEESREQFTRLVEVEVTSLEGWVGLTESLARLGREGESDEVLARARARFGDVPDLALLVGRQLLRRGAFEDAEAALAPLTGGSTTGRRAAAWSWIAVARAARGDAKGGVQAADEALALDREQPVARYALDALRGGKGTGALATGPR